MVLVEERDDVTATDAEVAQPTGRPTYPVVELRPGPRPLAVGEALTVGVDARPVGEPIVDEQRLRGTHGASVTQDTRGGKVTRRGSRGPDLEPPHVRRRESGDLDDEQDDRDDEEPGAEADRLRDGPGEGQTEGPRDERADQVERVDPGELVLRDVLLDRQVSEDREDRQAETVQEGAGADDERLVRQRHRQREQTREGQEDGAGEESAPRPPAQADQPARDESRHHAAECGTPGTAADAVSDDDGAEDALRPSVEQVV